jgi:hypothetical protein
MCVCIREQQHVLRWCFNVVLSGPAQCGPVYLVAQTAGAADIYTYIFITQVPLNAGRFTSRHKRLAQLMAAAAADCPVVWVGAEEPLFMLYTSGQYYSCYCYYHIIYYYCYYYY